MSHRASGFVTPILPRSEAIIEPSGLATHKPWGMDEGSCGGQDNLLGRIGWPLFMAR